MDRNGKMIQFFNQNGGVLRFKEIVNNGFEPYQIYKLLDIGKIERIKHGLFKLKNFDPDNSWDIIHAYIQSRNAVVCLTTALDYYRLTNEIRDHIDLAIPRGSRSNKITYPPVRFHHFSRESWKAGIDERTESGQKIRIYNIPKTIADCFKYRNKIGRDVPINALKQALEEKRTSVNEIMKYAKICRVENVILPILEVVL